MTEAVKKPRGFAAMNPEKAREIQRLGGRKSPMNFKNRTPEERRLAGSRGGSAKKGMRWQA